jgi:hypothetical protein
MNPFKGVLDRCPYCKKFMTSEQAENHICNSPLVDVKEISVLYFSKNSNASVIRARGLDGILYVLRKQKLPIRRKNTDYQSDTEETEPFVIIYK